MKKQISRRDMLWKSAKAAAGTIVVSTGIDALLPSTASASEEGSLDNQVSRVFVQSDLIVDAVPSQCDKNIEMLYLPRGGIQEAEEIGLTPEIARKYKNVKVHSFRLMSYFHFLGISPSTIGNYVNTLGSEWYRHNTYNIRGFDDFIMKNEFEKGNISSRAAKILKHHDIENPHRYSTKIMLSLERNMKNEPSNKPTALLIYNKNDKKHAFENDDRIMESLLDGYNLILYEADRDYKVIRKIRKTGKKFGKIDLLLLAGHGNQKNINFGEGKNRFGFINLSTADKHLMFGLERYFCEDSVIVLDSCATAQGGYEANNVAGTLKKYTGAIVFAPEIPTSLVAFEFDKKGKVIRPIYFHSGIMRQF